MRDGISTKGADVIGGLLAKPDYLLLLEKFPKDPLTGAFTPEILKSKAGIEALQSIFPDGCVLIAEDDNALSALNAYGFRNSADTNAATCNGDANRASIISGVPVIVIRIGGDERIILTSHTSHGADAQSLFRIQRVDSRKAILENDLSATQETSNEFYKIEKYKDKKERDKALGLVENLLRYKHALCQEYSNIRSGARTITRNYIESDPSPTLEGFEKYLRDITSKSNTESHKELFASALENRKDLCIARPIGSYDEAAIIIPEAPTIENIDLAIIQAQKALHNSKKSPVVDEDAEFNAPMPFLNEPDRRRKSRDKAEGILPEYSDSLRIQLENENDLSQREIIEKKVQRLDLVDPAIPICLRGSLLSSRTLSEVFAEPIGLEGIVVNFELHQFASLNNKLGYAKADEILSAALNEAIKDLKCPYEIIRGSGGAITFCFPKKAISINELNEMRDRFNFSVLEQIEKLPSKLQLSLELERLEKCVLNRVMEDHSKILEEKLKDLFKDDEARQILSSLISIEKRDETKLGVTMTQPRFDVLFDTLKFGA